jgi:hypothetical protein
MFVFGVITVTIAIVYGSYVQVYEQDRDLRKEIKIAVQEQNRSVWTR